VIWCIALTACLGCRTNPAPAAPVINLDLPLPQTPVIEPVFFEDRDGGLWLSYENYRALERNVITMREYAARLEIIIGFYREKQDR
jgi:hypothetical protein